MIEQFFVVGFRGIHCEFNINDCSSHPCQNGKCIDGINNYTCNCNSTGFQGRHCQYDINECNTVKPCKNNGTCHNTFGGYTCSCKSGYTGNVYRFCLSETDLKSVSNFIYYVRFAIMQSYLCKILRLFFHRHCHDHELKNYY